MANTYMPISVTLKNCNCLVVGGGRIALRKIDNLLDYETNITVVTPEPLEKIKFYAEKGKLKLEVRTYRPPEAAAYRLVISASDNPEVNQQVYDDARNSGALVNVVDNPPLCDFIFPALVKRGPLTAAISTDGRAPFLSGHLKTILETIFPDHWTKLARLAARYRKMVQTRWPDNPADRSDCFDAFLSEDWKSILDDMSEPEIEAHLEKLVESSPQPGPEKP